MCFHHYPFIFRQRKSSSVRGRQTEKGAKQKEIHGGKGKENERTHLIKRFHVKNLAFVMKVWSRKCEFQKDFKSFWPILWRWVIKKRFQHFSSVAFAYTRMIKDFHGKSLNYELFGEFNRGEKSLATMNVLAPTCSFLRNHSQIFTSAIMHSTPTLSQSFGKDIAICWIFLHLLLLTEQQKNTTCYQ